MIATEDARLVENLSDKKYFIETFFQIVNKERKLVPFILNPPQQRYYREKTDMDLVLKARKQGFSSLIEAEFLCDCMFGQNENAVTMAHTWDDTKIHLDRVEFFLKNMGAAGFKFNVTLDTANQREISFPETNSVYWIGTAGSRAFGRGRDITKLHCSEVAHYENQDVLTGILDACVPGARQVLETTANGIGEDFFLLWQMATGGIWPPREPRVSPWTPHFFAWFEDPTNRLNSLTGIDMKLKDAEKRFMATYGLDLNQVLWYRRKIDSAADKKTVPQEHPSNPMEAFITSGRPVFDQEILAGISQALLDSRPTATGEFMDDESSPQPKWLDQRDGRIRVYKFPRQGRKYIVVGDPCEGIPDGDSCVYHVLDRSSWEQVAVFSSRIDASSFGKEIVKAGYFYNNASLLPLLAGNAGGALVERIKSEKYPHIVNTRELWPDQKHQDGYPENVRTKGLYITALQIGLKERTFVLNCPDTVSELQTFIDNNGSMEARQGCHDDHVSSLGVGIYALKYLGVDETYDDRARVGVGLSGFHRAADVGVARRNRAGY